MSVRRSGVWDRVTNCDSLCRFSSLWTQQWWQKKWQLWLVVVMGNSCGGNDNCCGNNNDVTYLPISMGYRSCYKRYMKALGYDVRTTPMGGFVVTAEDEGQEGRKEYRGAEMQADGEKEVSLESSHGTCRHDRLQTQYILKYCNILYY